MTVGAAERVFSEQYGREPTVVASAPGRVNLVGGHTDYNDGFVLPVAVDVRTAVAAAPRGDGTLRVFTADLDDEVTVSVDALEPRSEQLWANYVLGVVAEFLGTAFGNDLGGVDLAIVGDVPRGAGLSSSAALELATAAAVYGVEHGDTDLPREALAELSWRAETSFARVECGIMDQYASALGRTGSALFLDCRSRDVELLALPDGVRIAVVDTGVSHHLADSAYNDRVAECQEALSHFDRWLGGVPALRDVDRQAFVDHCSRLRGVLRRRTRHVVTENERVVAAADALRAGDLDGIGSAMYASHDSLRDDYEVSCPELDAVVDIARETAGVVGARMTGGGFGGSVVVLVEDDATDVLAARIAAEYSTHVERDDEPQFFVYEAADGVRLDVVRDD